MSLQFLGESGIVADLEGFHALRFQPVSAPDAAHTSFADTDGCGHGAGAPVSGVGRWLARGHGHHAFGQAGTERGLTSGPGRVFLQSRNAQRQETLAPSRNFLRRNRHMGGDFQILLNGSREQDDASALRHPHRERAAPGLRFQKSPLPWTQRNGWGDSHPQASPTS